MKPFCEIVISDFLPAIRALVTKELMKNYGFSQVDVAKKLHVTQPAVSYYQRELRGTKMKLLQGNEKIMQLVKNLSNEIAANNLKLINIHDLCRTLKEEKILNGEFLECSCCTV